MIPGICGHVLGTVIFSHTSSGCFSSLLLIGKCLPYEEMKSNKRLNLWIQLEKDWNLKESDNNNKCTVSWSENTRKITGQVLMFANDTWPLAGLLREEIWKSALTQASICTLPWKVRRRVSRPSSVLNWLESSLYIISCEWRRRGLEERIICEQYHITIDATNVIVLRHCSHYSLLQWQ